MKEKILELRAQGLTYNQIKKELGCSKSTISYHCGKGQREKTKIKSKVEKFKNRVKIKSFDFQRNRATNGRWSEGRTHDFTFEDVLNKIGDNPICYLSGREIDLGKPETYSFDHIVPVNKGGSNKLENLGLTHRDANSSKHKMLVEEYLELCKEVLEHNGFVITKKEG